MQSNTYKFAVIFSLALFAWGCSKNQYSKNSSENDDMYFSSSDRKKVMFENLQASNGEKYSEDTDASSSKNTNPEYVQQYRTETRKQVERDQSGEEEQTEEYYNEDVAASKKYNKYDNYSNNNYSGYNNWGYNNYYGNYYGPAWSYGYARPWGYAPYSYYDNFWGPSFYGPRSGFSISFGWGSTWGYPYSNWNSFYDPWGYSPFYDGFYSPYNSWYGYNAYNAGFYNGFYYGQNRRPVVYYNNRTSSASYQEGVKYINRGPRESRGGRYSGNTIGSTGQASGRGGRVATSSSSGSQLRTTPENTDRPSRGVGRGSESYSRPNDESNAATSNQRISSSYDRGGRGRPSSEGSVNTDRFNSRPSEPAASRPSSRGTRGGFSTDNYNTNQNYNSNSNRSSDYSNSNRNYNNNNSYSTPSRSSGSSSTPSYSAPSSSGRSSSPSGGSSSGGGSRGTGRGGRP